MSKHKPKHANKIPSQAIPKARLGRSVAETNYSEDDGFYRIGFQYYDIKKCNTSGAKASDMAKVFEFLSHIGKCRTYFDIIGPKRKIAQEIKIVYNSNHYTKYFSGLTDDVEMKEFDVGELRAMFFFDHSAKTLQLVAIDHHPEDKKQRK